MLELETLEYWSEFRNTVNKVSSDSMTVRKSPVWLIVTFAVALRPEESNFKKKKG